jgi:hypothetical protein
MVVVQNGSTFLALKVLLKRRGLTHRGGGYYKVPPATFFGLLAHLPTSPHSLESLLGLCMGHRRDSGCDSGDNGTAMITKRSGMATGTAWLAEILL